MLFLRGSHLSMTCHHFNPFELHILSDVHLLLLCSPFHHQRVARRLCWAGEACSWVRRLWVKRVCFYLWLLLLLLLFLLCVCSCLRAMWELKCRTDLSVWCFFKRIRVYIRQWYPVIASEILSWDYIFLSVILSWDFHCLFTFLPFEPIIFWCMVNLHHWYIT